MGNKPSDVVDFMDKAYDIRDYMIDSQNQSCREEIQWLEDNYSNPEALRGYFLSVYNANNLALRNRYLNQMNGYTMAQLQAMAEFRANQLSWLYNENLKRKGNHSSLKAISEILKLMGK